MTLKCKGKGNKRLLFTLNKLQSLLLVSLPFRLGQVENDQVKWEYKIVTNASLLVMIKGLWPRARIIRE